LDPNFVASDSSATVSAFMLTQSRGPLSLVSTIEELVEKKVAATAWKAEITAVGIRHADHVAPSIRSSVGIVRP
jgi:hypothetical protein